MPSINFLSKIENKNLSVDKTNINHNHELRLNIRRYSSFIDNNKNKIHLSNNIFSTYKIKTKFPLKKINQNLILKIKSNKNYMKTNNFSKQTTKCESQTELTIKNIKNINKKGILKEKNYFNKKIKKVKFEEVVQIRRFEKYDLNYIYNKKNHFFNFLKNLVCIKD